MAQALSSSGLALARSAQLLPVAAPHCLLSSAPQVRTTPGCTPCLARLGLAPEPLTPTQLPCRSMGTTDLGQKSKVSLSHEVHNVFDVL